jgi:hypothetical protein
MTDDDFIWQVRTFVYGWFAGQAHAPGVADIAEHFDISARQADEALIALHEKHALFLKPGTVDIRMANPFSAIPTSFVVKVQEKNLLGQLRVGLLRDCGGVARLTGVDRIRLCCERRSTPPRNQHPASVRCGRGRAFLGALSALV